MYRHLENKMCKELEQLEEKYRTGTEMSEGDLRRIDLLVHSLKSLATYSAMKEAEEMSHMSGNSYNNGYSYAANGYTRGRDNMGVRNDMSGHFPMYPEDRRW